MSLALLVLQPRCHHSAILQQHDRQVRHTLGACRHMASTHEIDQPARTELYGEHQISFRLNRISYATAR